MLISSISRNDRQHHRASKFTVNLKHCSNLLIQTTTRRRYVSARDEEDQKPAQEKQRRGSKKGYQGQRKVQPKATKIIHVPAGEVCPHHDEPLRTTERLSKRLIIDLVVTKNGIRKTITEYVGIQGYCPKCQRYHVPPEIRKYGANQLYGYGFQAWIVYQRVALRMTYDSIAEMITEQFHENNTMQNTL